MASRIIVRNVSLCRGTVSRICLLRNLSLDSLSFLYLLLLSLRCWGSVFGRCRGRLFLLLSIRARGRLRGRCWGSVFGRCRGRLRGRLSLLGQRNTRCTVRLYLTNEPVATSPLPPAGLPKVKPSRIWTALRRASSETKV